MIDPRAAVIRKRLSGIERIIGFASAKGGVGKSTCACLAAIALANDGKRVGILDCDFQGASVHVLLGVTPRLPEEDRGVLPIPVSANLRLMTASLFVGNRPFPLRGSDVTDALLEMLAVTQWGRLDFLLIDLPPGMGDEVLDLVRLAPRMEALVISTPDMVALSVVERMLHFLQDVRVPVRGIIANMVRRDARPVQEMASRMDAVFVGGLPYDPDLEAAVGDISRLMRTRAAVSMKDVLANALAV